MINAVDLFNVLVLSFVGSVAGLIGGVAFLVKKEWARTLCKYAVPFAAGVLISVSLLHLLPEAEIELGYNAYLLVLISFFGSFLFEQYFATLHHHEGRGHTLKKTTIPLVITGDTIHNFIDGAAIASAYMIDPTFGVIIALSTFLHETPHEIGDFGVLIASGWNRKKTFLANLFSALATFPGAFLVLFVLKGELQKVGILLAISAGIFLFLGASDFLPDVTEEEDKKEAWKGYSLVILGVLVMYFLKLISPEY